MVIKRWRPGTPQVTAALRQVFGKDAPLRVGIRRASEANSRNLPKQPWGKDPHLQADPARINEALVTIPTLSDYLGEGWELVGVPFAGESAQFRAQYARLRWTAWSVGFAVALFVALGFWLRHRSQKRALLDADRMASMTHSLKTPLAILKFRCDTLRLGRLTQDQADEELLKLGSEVDNMALMIENGLRVIRGSNEVLPAAEVDPDWLRDVAEDLEPAFEAEGRKLDLRLVGTKGRAPLSSLRSALFTLLENALFHGKGTVVLESVPLRNRLQLHVSDEGEGLESHQLQAIGKPFLRLRQQGKEGFQREGQGLGLSLLCQVAEKEGWGLSFASAPGMGFHATLEIPVA
jgi:signal transduction histidine kinase